MEGKSHLMSDLIWKGRIIRIMGKGLDNAGFDTKKNKSLLLDLVGGGPILGKPSAQVIID